MKNENQISAFVGHFISYAIMIILSGLCIAGIIFVIKLIIRLLK